MDGTWALLHIVLPAGATTLLLGAGLILTAGPGLERPLRDGAGGLLLAAGTLTGMLLTLGVGHALSGRF